MLRISFLACTCLFACNAVIAQEQKADVAKFAIPAVNDGLPGSGPIRRYDWFQGLWQQRRAQWAKQIEQDTGAVVFLGDSITQGWGDKMGGSFGEMPVANRGISGDTTRGMLIRLNDDVLSLKPRCIVMLMGTNDLEEGAEPEQVAGNVKLIVDAIKMHSAQVPIVLCQVFPSSADKQRPADKIKRVNELVAQSVKGDSAVIVLDTWTIFANAQGDAKIEEFPDLLHPNEAGYQKWAAALRPIFATLGYIETAPSNFVIEEGYESLFNGRDLTGWCLLPTSEKQKQSVNRQKNNPNAPAWPIIEKRIDLDGKTTSPDGRYQAINGRLVVTTPAEGRRIQQLWTTREFTGDFTLKLEFRATPNADSGVFLREPQLQCRDYLLAGPYKELKEYRPQDWNELIVEVNGNTARCTCNGEVIEPEFKLPDSGPIGLEGDRGQMEYRNIRIKRSVEK
ncbi:MAG: GDSL-type esterase/lipase family protein [Pirellulaceae bacterium]